MKKYIGQHIFDYVASFRQNVGIGTDSPNRKVSIQGTNNTALSIVSPTSNYVQLALGDTDDDNYGQIILDNSSNKLQIQNGGGGVVSNRGITLDSSENVGISIDSPAAQFHINPSGTIGWGNLGNAGILVGANTGAGVGIDQNEIASKGDHLYIGTITADKDLIFRTGGANNRLVIDGSTGDVTISSNLTVSGTTTTINTTNLNVEDKNITLNYSTGDSSSTADGAGITIQDAVDSSNDATLLWDATNDQFDFSHSISLGNNKRIIFNDSSGNDGTSITYDTNALFKITQANSGELRLNAGFNSNSNNKITFMTQGSSEKMRITNDGDVGIGTNDPHNKTHIVSTSSDNGLLIDCSNGSNNNFTGVYFKIDNNTTNAYKKGALVWERTGSYNEGRFHFLLNNEDNVNNVGLSDSKMTILSTGNVGIGTVSPSQALHVKGRTFFDREVGSLGNHIISEFKNTDGTNNPVLKISSTATGMKINTGFSTGITGSFELQADGGSSYIGFNTNGSNERMRLTSAGDLGIGTNSPAQKLDVIGTVRAVGLNINSTFGADNVQFTNATNDKYEMGSIETKLNAMPFPLDYHDVLSFGRNYTITQEISTDGTNFSSMTLEPDVFNMRTDNSVRVIDGSLSTEEQAVRYIVSNVAYVSAQFLKICFTFTGSAAAVTVTVHTCTDADFESGSGTTTQRHTSTVSSASSKTVYFYLDYHGADSHMRITLDKGNNTDNKNVNVSSLQLLTRRNGDQGQGPEYNLPIDWDYNRNVTIPGSLTVNGADAIVIPDYILHAGDTDSKFGFPANDNFKVRLSGLDVFTMSNSAMAFTGTMTASSYKISAATVLSGSTNVTLGSAGATGTISLATHTSTPFKIEDDDSITITAGDSVAPEVNLLHDGTNPGTGEQLGVVQFQVDYNGSHQDWGDIELRTTTAATRTKLNFNVKSTSGNVLNALTLDGTTDGTTAAFAGPVTSNSLSVATTKNVVLVHGTGGVVGNSGSNSSDSHTWTITHGMGSSRNYKVEVMLNSGNYDTVYPDITRPSDTTIVVTFGAAVANSAYKALILKCE